MLFVKSSIFPIEFCRNYSIELGSFIMNGPFFINKKYLLGAFPAPGGRLFSRNHCASSFYCKISGGLFKAH